MRGVATHSGHATNLLVEVARWAVPRFLVYVITAVVAAVLFFAGAAIYVSFWPELPVEPRREVIPSRAPVQHAPAPTPIGPSSPAERGALVASGATFVPASGVVGINVFDVNNVRVGSIKELMLNPKGNAEIVVIDLFGGATAGKIVTVPFKDVTWTTDPVSKGAPARAVVQYSAHQLQAAPIFGPN